MNDMLMMLCLMRMLMNVLIGLNACLTHRVLHAQGLTTAKANTTVVLAQRTGH